MGQTLSEPVTEKSIIMFRGHKRVFGVTASMQGWRMNMEDTHTNAHDRDKRSVWFAAVFDGHGGCGVAEYAKDRLYDILREQPSYVAGDYPEALRASFLALDEEMMNDVVMRRQLSGCTAVTILITEDKLYVANIGDSRAVACYAGRCDPLTEDHKPNNRLERQRIVDAGGWVECNRVNGNLALSRAFGDFVFKRNEKKPVDQQIVIALPDIQTRDITDDLEFIVLACDGIWDVMSNEEVVDFIRHRIAQNFHPKEICEELITHCLSPDCEMGGLGCDNMTVTLIYILPIERMHELAERCAVPPETRTRLCSTSSSDSSIIISSCSTSTQETSDEELVSAANGDASNNDTIPDEDNNGSLSSENRKDNDNKTDNGTDSPTK